MLLAAFVVRQARIANPLMPLRLFRSRNVTGANIVHGAARRRACSACSSSARCTCSEILGYTPLEVGLAFLPATVVMGVAVAALLAGR